MNIQRLTVIALIALLTAARFLPQLPNATPVLAIALFAGAVAGSRTTSFTVLLAAMLISDFFIGFHSTIPFVYGALGLILILGKTVYAPQKQFSVVTASLSSNVLFFLITNVGVWLVQDLYTKDLAGLMLCFTLAIPFFFNALFATLLYLGLTTAAWNFLARHWSQDTERRTTAHVTI